MEIYGMEMATCVLFLHGNVWNGNGAMCLIPAFFIIP
jgi:hypothetical protein